MTDDLGFRFISREAFPCGGSGLYFGVSGDAKKGMTLSLSPRKFPFVRVTSEFKPKDKDGKYTFTLGASFKGFSD